MNVCIKVYARTAQIKQILLIKYESNAKIGKGKCGHKYGLMEHIEKGENLPSLLRKTKGCNKTDL